MDYCVEEGIYSFSYQEIKEHYNKYCNMSDKEFMDDLSGALHLASFICWLKEIPSYNCLSDRGIIHQLIHLLHIPDEPLIDIKEIRKQFKKDLLIA